MTGRSPDLHDRRRKCRSSWHVADGIITAILGVLVLAQWRASGLWVIGLFVGIDLIFYGGA
jgi:uncharacterized membrane protein HdeD (DUF308 family)